LLFCSARSPRRNENRGVTIGYFAAACQDESQKPARVRRNRRIAGRRPCGREPSSLRSAVAQPSRMAAFARRRGPCERRACARTWRQRSHVRIMPRIVRWRLGGSLRANGGRKQASLRVCRADEAPGGPCRCPFSARGRGNKRRRRSARPPPSGRQPQALGNRSAKDPYVWAEGLWRCSGSSRAACDSRDETLGADEAANGRDGPRPARPRDCFARRRKPISSPTAPTVRPAPNNAV